MSVLVRALGALAEYIDADEKNAIVCGGSRMRVLHADRTLLLLLHLISGNIRRSYRV